MQNANEFASPKQSPEGGEKVVKARRALLLLKSKINKKTTFSNTHYGAVSNKPSNSPVALPVESNK